MRIPSAAEAKKKVKTFFFFFFQLTLLLCRFHRGTAAAVGDGRRALISAKKKVYATMLMFPLLRGVRDGTDSEEKSPKPRRQTEKRRVGGEIKLRRLYTYVRVSYVLSLSARLFMLSITWPPGFERIQKKKGKKKRFL